MHSWVGDENEINRAMVEDMWASLATLRETDGMSIEPKPLNLTGLKVSPLCRHCKDPFLAIDEDSDGRYRGLCPPCAEWYRDQDELDAEVMAHEEAPSHLL